jgi:peptidoglycan hydrolase CwlO-like protein
MTESKNDSEKPVLPSRLFKVGNELLIHLITVVLASISIIQIFEIIFFRKTFESDLDTTKFLILIGSVVFITLLNIGLGLLGVKTGKNTTETKLLSIDKPILLTVKTDNANLQKNIDTLSHQKKELKAEVSSLENEISIVERKFFTTIDQIRECEDKSSQRVERAANKARNFQLAFVLALFTSSVFGTYLARLYLNFNSEYSTLFSFLLVLLLDFGFAFIFASSLLTLEIAKKVAPILNIILVISLIFLMALFAYSRTGECLFCDYLFPLLHLNLGLIAGIFFYQYQLFSWSTELTKEKKQLEKSLSELKLKHQRGKADIDILTDMISSHQKKVEMQKLSLENPRF